MKRWLLETTTVIAIAVAGFAVTAPSVAARIWTSQAGASGLTRIQEPGSVSDFDTYEFQGPTGVYDTGVGESGAANGFAWDAAAVGGAFVLGLGLAAAGVRLTLRRRTVRQV